MCGTNIIGRRAAAATKNGLITTVIIVKTYLIYIPKGCSTVEYKALAKVIRHHTDVTFIFVSKRGRIL